MATKKKRSARGKSAAPTKTATKTAKTAEMTVGEYAKEWERAAKESAEHTAKTAANGKANGAIIGKWDRDSSHAPVVGATLPDRVARRVAADGGVKSKPRAPKAVEGAPKFRIVEVTPAMAAKWLEKNVENNRPISSTTVAQYARDMSSGNWEVTPEPIVFNVLDQCVNGQHRLHAIIVSGQTVTMTVATGFALEFDSPLDQGRVRTLAQVLHADNRWVAVVRAMHSLESGKMTRRTRMSLSEVQAAYKRHARDIDRVWPQYRKLNGGVIAAIAWALPLDQDVVLKFATQLRDGEMLTRGEPAYGLRNWFPRNAKASSYEQAYATCNAIRAVFQDETLAHVYTGPTGYRWICQRRRAEKIPHTPSGADVPALGSTQDEYADSKHSKTAKRKSAQLSLGGTDE